MSTSVLQSMELSNTVALHMPDTTMLRFRVDPVAASDYVRTVSHQDGSMQGSTCKEVRGVVKDRPPRGLKRRAFTSVGALSVLVAYRRPSSRSMFSDASSIQSPNSFFVIDGPHHLRCTVTALVTRRKDEQKVRVELRSEGLRVER
jgi:hypothetical protein